jgi:hypothetical protein
VRWSGELHIIKSLFGFFNGHLLGILLEKLLYYSIGDGLLDCKLAQFDWLEKKCLLTDRPNIFLCIHFTEAEIRENPLCEHSKQIICRIMRNQDKTIIKPHNYH